MHTAGAPEIAPERIDELIEIRVIRQRLLIERAPLQLITVIDAAMPHRVVGGPAVMAEQLDWLVEAARLPNVTVFSAPHTAAPTCKAAGGTPTDLTQGSVCTGTKWPKLSAHDTGIMKLPSVNFIAHP